MAMNAKTATRAFRALRVRLTALAVALSANQSQPATILPAIVNARSYATSEPSLKDTLKEVIPEKRELLKKVKAHGDKVIGEVKIENTLGGMR